MVKENKKEKNAAELDIFSINGVEYVKVDNKLVELSSFRKKTEEETAQIEPEA